VNFARAVVGLTAPEMKYVRERVHQTLDDDKMSKSVRYCVYVVNAYVWYLTSHGLVWVETELTTKQRKSKNCHVVRKPFSAKIK